MISLCMKTSINLIHVGVIHFGLASSLWCRTSWIYKTPGFSYTLFPIFFPNFMGAAGYLGMFFLLGGSLLSNKTKNSRISLSFLRWRASRLAWNVSVYKVTGCPNQKQPCQILDLKNGFTNWEIYEPFWERIWQSMRTADRFYVPLKCTKCGYWYQLPFWNLEAFCIFLLHPLTG